MDENSTERPGGEDVDPTTSPSGWELARLEAEILSGAVRLSVARAQWLGWVAEFDARDGWAVSGVRSCAHWLAWQCGLGPGAAREQVRVARALRSLPVLREAFATGRLSFSMVRALTRVAEPATEAGLLELASHSTASQVERVVREWRRSDAVTAGETARAVVFEHWWDGDGMLCLRLRMPAEPGAELLAAIESVVERTARRERAAATRAAGGLHLVTEAETSEAGESKAGESKAGESPPDAGDSEPDEPAAFPRERLAARRCAALTLLAGAVADTDRRAGDPPRREVVVHVDAAVLADDTAAGQAHLDGGPALHPSQVHRMLCEAAVTAIVHDGPEVLAQGRARRYATRAQRRALLARDRGCVHPGCTESRVERLHAHHLVSWLAGGRTDVSNMVLLCDVHHGQVHDEGITLSRPRGRLVAHDATGGQIWVSGATPGNPTDRSTDPLTHLLPAAGPVPAGWRANGERMDLAHVVWVLLANRDLIRRRAA